MSEILKQKITRRELFAETAALTAGTLLFHTHQNAAVTSAEGAEKRITENPAELKMKQILNEAKAVAEENGTEHKKATALDWVGTAWFAKGVYELFGKQIPGVQQGRGHLGAT